MTTHAKHLWVPRRISRSLFLRTLVATGLLLALSCGQALGESLLWKGVQNGKTLYLMGSIHVLQASHYPLPVAMEDAFRNSEVVVFEMDQDEMESPAIQQLMLNKGFYQEGERLEDNIGQATFQHLKNHLEHMQLPLAIFQSMRPANCALVLTMMEYQRLGFEPRFGLDQYFADKAKAEGKKREALESAEYQLNLFFELSPEQQNKLLQQTLLELENFTREASSMSQAWQQGDSQRLHRLLSASFKEFPELHERLIAKRNRNWLPQVQGFLSQYDNVLVIVGAGHLVGPDSLRALLEARGLSFQQL